MDADKKVEAERPRGDCCGAGEDGVGLENDAEEERIGEVGRWVAGVEEEEEREKTAVFDVPAAVVPADEEEREGEEEEEEEEDERAVFPSEEASKPRPAVLAARKSRRRSEVRVSGRVSARLSENKRSDESLSYNLRKKDARQTDTEKPLGR